MAQSPTKRPTFAFTGESGYTLAFRRRIAHNGLHTETGGVSDGVVSLPSERSARSETSPGRVSERQILPLLGLGRGDSRRTQRACGTVMRLCASLFRRRRGPAGLRDLFLLLPKLRLLRRSRNFGRSKKRSRSPAGPRRLRNSDAHKRITVPQALCVLRESPRPRPKSGKICRSDTRPGEVSERAERSEGNDTTPSETPPVSVCKPLCAILLRKARVYPLSPVKANVGRFVGDCAKTSFTH